ncbi:Serine/threonine-protein kinase PrkC [Luteitalea pratensis]|uniref:Serine/threonine-protein kinase PrkC n=1 Tax=Luteitalea pratensis TaxID=1855912 RepID=A0A143PJN2_LUTPR|nr:protein kinase [Luteitalea pratensis]AMY08453.1 Serine/threonine-protein kinase PrkC [Luteitalea pratensis]
MANHVDWERAKLVFQAALECEASERPGLVAEECRGDAALHAEVLSLLDAHARAGSFAERHAVPDVPEWLATPSTAATLHSGARLGPYEIVGWLGAGGMGAVYSARDPRLGRTVAIKVLHRELRDDPAIALRFEHEARTLATLNHPNIASIYGVEDVGDTRALVLEYVDGDTLAQRVARGPIAVGDALQIARQIAEALDSAHQHGFIHRDLKPANVKLRPDGTAKLLDFGLARMLEGYAPGPLDSPPRATAGGQLVGTPAYMSPEQVKGLAGDRRSDVWAFGCVLFEMLSGRPVFGAATAGETFVEILGREPDWQRLPGATPPAIRRLLGRCLNKDDSRRVRDFGDIRLDVDDGQREWQSKETSASRASDMRGRRTWLGVAAVVALAGVAVWMRPAPSEPVRPQQQFDVATPAILGPADLESFALSPDGQSLAFVGAWQGAPHLWVRPLPTVVAHPLDGTRGASAPFWSPDHRSIAYYAEGQLKRIDVDGALVRSLTAATWGGGGSWNVDDTLLFVRTPAGPILRISATGGEPHAVTRLEKDQAGHVGPQWLPDGRHFLYYVLGTPEARGVHVGNVDGTAGRKLVDADSSAVYTQGHLLFVRQQTLFACAFDAGRMALTGTPFEIADGVIQRTEGLGGPTAVAAAANGTIAFRAGNSRPQTQFTWIDRTGRNVLPVGAVDGMAPTASPGLEHIAMMRRVGGNADVWLMETARGLLTKFTTHPAEDVFPYWSRDGQDIVFSSNRDGRWALYRKRVTGGREEPLLQTGQEASLATDSSPDGRLLLYHGRHPMTGWDIGTLSVQDGVTTAVVQTEADERNGQFSPDGAWLAYESNDSGPYEVFLRRFPEGGPRVQVSTRGGSQARWRGDGHELFYVGNDGMLMAVTVHAARGDGSVKVGSPVPLFPSRIGAGTNSVPGAQYVVTADGQRFLVDAFEHDVSLTPIRLILNWSPLAPQRPDRPAEAAGSVPDVNRR